MVINRITDCHSNDTDDNYAYGNTNVTGCVVDFRFHIGVVEDVDLDSPAPN